jgi:hypothetical protein
MFAAALLFVSCSNSQSDTTPNDGRDTTNRRDTLPNTETNTVTPPASNGQF